MEQNINAFMNGYFPDRMMQNGPNRKKNIISKHLQQDRKIISSLLLQSVITVLKRDNKFTDEQIQTFHSNLQKEIDQ